MKKWLKIVIVIWFLIFLTDMITAFVARPIFCIVGTGGEVSTHIGLGYIINYYYGWGLPTTPPQINAWGYIIVNATILMIYFIGKRMKIKKGLTKNQPKN